MTNRQKESIKIIVVVKWSLQVTGKKEQITKNVEQELGMWQGNKIISSHTFHLEEMKSLIT